MWTALMFIAAVGLAYYLGHTLCGFEAECDCDHCTAERRRTCRSCFEYRKLEQEKKWRDA